MWFIDRNVQCIAKMHQFGCVFLSSIQIIWKIIMLYSIMRTYSDIVNHAFRCFLYCLNGENSGSIVVKNAMVHHRITWGWCIKWNHSAIFHRVISYKLTILTFCCYHRDQPKMIFPWAICYNNRMMCIHSIRRNVYVMNICIVIGNIMGTNVMSWQLLA